MRRIGGVSDKVLTESLRRLSTRGLVTKATGEHPDARRDRAGYRLTALGESFATGPLARLARWAAENQDDLAATS